MTLAIPKKLVFKFECTIILVLLCSQISIDDNPVSVSAQRRLSVKVKSKLYVLAKCGVKSYLPKIWLLKIFLAFLPVFYLFYFSFYCQCTSQKVRLCHSFYKHFRIPCLSGQI